MTAKSLIVKDNRLIEACYRLDLAEQRLILLAIVRARDAKKTITADLWLEVSVKDYNDTYGFGDTAGYKVLNTAAASLFNRYVRINLIDPATGKDSHLSTRWVSACHYVEQASLVRIQISPLMIPYITNLESKFTSYQLKNVAKMTSAYAIRLFELMMQYRNIGERYITIDNLKEYLGATGEGYARVDNFKNKVVVPAIAQINKHTELNVEFINRKVGRSVVGYDFKITAKEDQQPKQPAKRAAKIKPNAPTPLPTGLTLAEKNMIKKICAKTGESDADVLAKAQAMGVELFVALDQMTKAV